MLRKALLLAWLCHETALADVAAEDWQDPTRPPLHPSTTEGGSPKPASLPRVSAIFISKDGHGRAVVDGVPMKVGDTWNGVTLISVVPGRVRIQRDSELIDLPLLGTSIKKDTRDPR